MDCSHCPECVNEDARVGIEYSHPTVTAYPDEVLFPIALQLYPIALHTDINSDFCIASSNKFKGVKSQDLGGQAASQNLEITRAKNFSRNIAITDRFVWHQKS
ncbi:uncharacterized protein LOC118746107 [Rhagoletis pomonella]|uniref:uncharacterized protein LOC118746107 n=1 Tax=Rhagoletis pomonella TaxID=28610 RepID=UPI00177D4AB6|nr:uncharacterized protein LOC118746107 [Rhagoletis pomonella]